MKEELTVQECLGHYLSDKDPSDLALFCNIEPRSVSNWNTHTPNGLNLVKSTAFLATKGGYSIKGYDYNDLEFKAIVAIGYNFATVSQVASLSLIHISEPTRRTP